MNDDKQTMMGLMSLGVVIITVECGFSLGKELDLFDKSLLLSPMVFSICAITIGLIGMALEDGFIYSYWNRFCAVMIWSSAILLIVVSMSGIAVG